MGRNNSLGRNNFPTYDGTLETIHHALYAKCREQIGREASPTAAIIDSGTREKRRKSGAVSTHRATMQARKSTAKSAISSSIL
jgi:hypothetical protein